MASRFTRIACLVAIGVVSAQLPAAENPENGASKPATRPATRPVKTATPMKAAPAAKPTPLAKPAGEAAAPRRNSGKSKELPPAVAEALKKAMADFHKELETSDLRSTSNYFVENPAKELSVDMVFGLLERRIEQTSHADAYVKWQLLSALPRTISEEYRPRVIPLLRAAPSPEALPGLVSQPEQRRQFEDQMRRFGEDDAPQVLKELEAAQDKVRLTNDTILAYRDSLVALLPDNYAGVSEAFSDAYARAQSGDAGKAFDGAARNASRWLFTKPPPREVEQLQNLIDELKTAPKAELVTRFRWDQKNGLLRPETRKIGLEPNAVRTLENEIAKALGNQGDAPLDAAKDDGPRGRRRR